MHFIALLNLHLQYMMFLPKIINYKPFYIQTSKDEFAIDTMQYGLVFKSSPYPIFPKVKSIYKNDWKDENGDDEYIGKTRIKDEGEEYISGIFYEAFTLPITFYAKAFGTEEKSAASLLRQQIMSFFQKISNSEFCIYDSYKDIGYQNVRYESIDEQNIQFKAKANWARVIFSINFKINDPVTKIYNNNGKLEVQQ